MKKISALILALLITVFSVVPAFADSDTPLIPLGGSLADAMELYGAQMQDALQRYSNDYGYDGQIVYTCLSGSGDSLNVYVVPDDENELYGAFLGYYINGGIYVHCAFEYDTNNGDLDNYVDCYNYTRDNLNSWAYSWHLNQGSMSSSQWTFAKAVEVFILPDKPFYSGAWENSEQLFLNANINRLTVQNGYSITFYSENGFDSANLHLSINDLEFSYIEDIQGHKTNLCQYVLHDEPLNKYDSVGGNYIDWFNFSGASSLGVYGGLYNAQANLTINEPDIHYLTITNPKPNGQKIYISFPDTNYDACFMNLIEGTNTIASDSYTVQFQNGQAITTDKFGNAVNLGTSDFVTPDDTEDGNILSRLFNSLTNTIKNILEPGQQAINNLVQGGSGFMKAVSTFYSFLPSALTTVITSALIVVVVVGVIKIFH